MKELRKKTILTLVSILSFILLSVMILVNVRYYAGEKEGIMRSLDILENKRGMRDPEGQKPGEEAPKPDERRMRPRDMENVMIMDYEIYIVEIADGAITKVFNAGNSSEGFDANAVAEEILAKEKDDRISVGNLYLKDSAYRYRAGESIVILNAGEIRKKLWRLLIESIVLFAITEAAIVFISGLIAKWITKPAEEAFARQKEFIADASHELKTPLAVIMASADELESTEKDKKYIDNIRYESERMNKLIKGLLNLSRLENGEDAASYREEDLSLILEKTCMAYEAVAFEQGVLIETEIEEGMSFRCNKEDMEQMAAILLDNAVRHSYKDSSVKVTAVMNKGLIDIRIVNTGDPIPEEDKDRIFERFYRGDKSRSRRENNYGLGLAIARRIARNHNGDINAESADGKTVFRVSLKK